MITDIRFININGRKDGLRAEIVVDGIPFSTRIPNDIETISRVVRRLRRIADNSDTVLKTDHHTEQFIAIALGE